MIQVAICTAMRAADFEQILNEWIRQAGPSLQIISIHYAVSESKYSALIQYKR